MPKVKEILRDYYINMWLQIDEFNIIGCGRCENLLEFEDFKVQVQRENDETKKYYGIDSNGECFVICPKGSVQGITDWDKRWNESLDTLIEGFARLYK